MNINNENNGIREYHLRWFTNGNKNLWRDIMGLSDEYGIDNIEDLWSKDGALDMYGERWWIGVK